MMPIRSHPSIVLGLVLFAAGCGGRTGLGTAGVSLDASPDRAAAADGGSLDVPLRDLAAADAGIVDRGMADLAAPDAPWLIDQAAADRATPDALVRLDRGARDLLTDVTVDAGLDAPRPPDLVLPDAAVGDATVDRGRDTTVRLDGPLPADASVDRAPPDASVDAPADGPMASDTRVADAGPLDAAPTDARLPDSAPPDALADVQPDAPPYDPVLAVSRSRYLADLTQIAKLRAPQSAHWQWVQSYCAKTFAEAGFQVELHAFSSGGQSGVNVVGTRAGSTRPAEQVIVSAHYDHIAGCAGADDNASGVAAVLEAARVLAAAPHARTLIVACWDLEEAGLLGSQAYAARARQRAQQLTMVYVMEMIGYRSTAPGSQAIPNEPLFALLFPQQVAAIRANQYRGDFIAAFGDNATASALATIETTAARVGLSAITGAQSAAVLALTPLARSDHSSFWLQSYPALFITDTAEFRNPNYHCRNGSADTLQTLDIDFAVQTTRAMVGSAHGQLGAP